jgi:hypothetical protein
MIKQIFLISFLSVLVLGSWGCKKTSEAACSTAWASELSDEITAVSNTAQAYALDPTTENCLAYKAALQAYIDALKPYGNCAALTGQDRDAWQAAIDDAQQNVDNMTCE